MFSLHGFIASLALLLCSCASAQSSSEVRILLKNWTLPEFSPQQIVVYGNRMFADDEDSISFMTCNKQGHIQENNLPYLCNVTVETRPHPNGIFRNTCKDITITTNDNDKEQVSHFSSELWAFNLNRVIILSNGFKKNATGSYPRAQLIILDMSTCGIVKNLAFIVKQDRPKSQTQPILYRDNFEVILDSPDKCGPQLPRCRVTYDFDGRQIGEPKLYETATHQMALTVADQTPDKGYYSIGLQRGSKLIVWYVDPSGRAKELMSNITIPQLLQCALSSAHELFSICWLDDFEAIDLGNYVAYNSRQLRCVQTNTQKQSLNVTLEPPRYTRWVAARNLEGGEILIAMGNCAVNVNVVICNGFRVQRTAADGQQRYKALDVDGLKINVGFKRNFEVQISENSRDEFCFSRDWVEKVEGNTILKYEKRCIPAKDTLTAA